MIPASLVDEDSDKKLWKLTEREVFGFIWQKETGRSRTRDDQVISRLLTAIITAAHPDTEPPWTAPPLLEALLKNDLGRGKI